MFNSPYFLYYFIVFLAVVIAEFLYIRSRKKPYELTDALLAFFIFIPQSSLFRIFVTFGLYKLVSIKYGRMYPFNVLQVDFTQLSYIYQCIIFFVIFDFLKFFRHWLVHKVPLFWFFHCPHHSHKDFYTLLEFRFHPMDNFIRNFLTVIILAFFLFDNEVVIGMRILYQAYTLLNHNKIRWHIPIINDVVVSPRTHYVHHTQEGCRYNYGTILTIWDRIWGTYREKVSNDEMIQTHSDDNFWQFLYRPYVNMVRYILKK
jgi:sterol desaturase/sphingolipid hydroxylase (fatty acid hydroxylase superfamily)